MGQVERFPYRRSVPITEAETPTPTVGPPGTEPTSIRQCGRMNYLHRMVSARDINLNPVTLEPIDPSIPSG